jgi:hypothetical protein
LAALDIMQGLHVATASSGTSGRGSGLAAGGLPRRRHAASLELSVSLRWSALVRLPARGDAGRPPMAGTRGIGQRRHQVRLALDGLLERVLVRLQRRGGAKADHDRAAGDVAPAADDDAGPRPLLGEAPHRQEPALAQVTHHTTLRIGAPPAAVPRLPPHLHNDVKKLLDRKPQARCPVTSASASP